MNDFAEINQIELLEAISCPVLIIHGNSLEDKEELELLANTRAGMHMLSDKSELIVFEDAGHSFMNHLDQVIDLTSKWYVKYMSL